MHTNVHMYMPTSAHVHLCMLGVHTVVRRSPPSRAVSADELTVDQSKGAPMSQHAHDRSMQGQLPWDLGSSTVALSCV